MKFSLRSSIRKFVQKGSDADSKKVNKIYDDETLNPIFSHEITKYQEKGSLRSLIFQKEVQV